MALPGQTLSQDLSARPRTLLDLRRQLNDPDKLIIERFHAHPQAQALKGMPGMGPVLRRNAWPPPPDSLRYPTTPAPATGYSTGTKRYHRRLRHIF